MFPGGLRIVHLVTEIRGSRLSRAFVLGVMALVKALSLSSKCMRSVVTVHRVTRGIMWVRPDALDGWTRYYTYLQKRNLTLKNPDGRSTSNFFDTTFVKLK